MYVHRALAKTAAVEIDKRRLEKNPKDQRNLHLLRLSIIRPGTARANGMSDADARKRATVGITSFWISLYLLVLKGLDFPIN